MVEMIIECIKCLAFGTLLGGIITLCRIGLPAPIILPPYFTIFGYWIGYKIISYFL